MKIVEIREITSQGLKWVLNNVLKLIYAYYKEIPYLP